MAKIRRSPCPLCLNLVPTNHIGVAGCPTCEDERTLLRRSYVEVRLPRGVALDERFRVRHQKFIAHNKEMAVRREEILAQKEKEAEIKRLSIIHREEASISLAKRSLLHYVERRKPDYKANWHHEIIAWELEQFLVDVEAGKHPRLMLLVSSRGGKSELASNSYPAWVLGHRPEYEILLCSASDALPTEFSRNIREQIRSDDYRKIFPRGATLRQDSTAALRWQTDQGGGLKAIGNGGTLLGFGFNIGIFDDIHKSMEEVDNPERSLAVWNWFSSIAYSRGQSKSGIVIVCQRMHDEDLAGRLLKRQYEDEQRIISLRKEAQELADESPDGMDDHVVKQMLDEAEELNESIDRWRVVEFPAIAKANEYFCNDTHEILRYPKGIPPEKGNLRLLRQEGEALDSRYSRQYYLKIKRNNPRHFAAMYQLSPQTDDTAYFDVSRINRYTPNERPKTQTMTIVTAWDLAIETKKQNDHTVGLAMGIDYKRRVWLLDRIKGKWNDIRIIADLIIDLHIKWGSSITGIERMMVERALMPILQSRMQERNEYINVAQGKEALAPISDKATRARAAQGYINNGLFYVPEGESWDEYISVLSRFLVSNIDDDTDATAWCGILLNRTAPPTDPREENRRKREEEDLWGYDFEEFLSRCSRSYMES